MIHCVVAWFVGWSVCHSSESCKNGSTDQDAIWVEDSGGLKLWLKDEGACTKVAFMIQNEQYLWNEAV